MIIDFIVPCVILSIEQITIKKEAITYEYFKIHTKIHGSSGTLSEACL